MLQFLYRFFNPCCSFVKNKYSDLLRRQQRFGKDSLKRQYRTSAYSEYAYAELFVAVLIRLKEVIVLLCGTRF